MILQSEIHHLKRVISKQKSNQIERHSTKREVCNFEKKKSRPWKPIKEKIIILKDKKTNEILKTNLILHLNWVYYLENTAVD